MRALGLIGLLALAVAIPAGATATGGLRGVVMRGPVTPVCQAGTSCDAPAKNVTIAFSRNGVSHTATTDAHGHYAIALAPGTYSVAIVPGRFGFTPRHVLVPIGRIAVRNFSIDTGIR